MKRSRLTATLSALILAASLFGCAPQSNGASSSSNATSEQSVGAYTQEMTDDAAKQMETELGAFEITAAQRELAKTNEAGYAPWIPANL